VVLEITNVYEAMNRVDEDDKQRFSLGLPGKAPWVITESGLYSLVLTSRKPEANRFKKWVTSEVRVVTLADGQPGFVAADVCKVLGIGRTDDGVGRLDEDEKGAASIRTPGDRYLK